MPRYSALRRQPPGWHSGAPGTPGTSCGGGTVGNSGVNSSGGVALGSVNSILTDATSANCLLGIKSNSTCSGVSNAAVAGDASDEEVNQLFRELESSVDGLQALAVMRDTLCVIERRALSRCDPHSRDFFLEQRIRDVLSELTRTGDEKLLMVAVNFISALLAVPYTNPYQKYTRLCRSLFVVLHCGIEEPAREAQRVLKHMLQIDMQFAPIDRPLKSFITKELKDTCELALLQLHGRGQQTKTPFVAEFLSVMLAVAVTAEVNPWYISAQLRPRVVQLATALAGSSNAALRRAAYDCLLALFSNISAMRHNEVVLENRRVLDDAIRSLNTSHNNESNIVSTLESLRALISSREIKCVDKQAHILPQLCVLVTEQHRVSKSAAVRNAVCNLVPVIAEVDIAAAVRRTTYCAIIMEPVKNVRDESNKGMELRNVGAFIQNVGYGVLDYAKGTNLNSIITRYITQRDTQEECWYILTAICSTHTKAGEQCFRVVAKANSSPGSIGVLGDRGGLPQQRARQCVGESDSGTRGHSQGVQRDSPNPSTVNADLQPSSEDQTLRELESLVRHCIPYMSHAVLTSNLVLYIATIQKRLPSVSVELQVALDGLVDCTLKNASANLSQLTECFNVTAPSTRQEEPSGIPGVPRTQSDAPQSEGDHVANSTAGSFTRCIPSVMPMDNGTPFTNRVSSFGSAAVATSDVCGVGNAPETSDMRTKSGGVGMPTRTYPESHLGSGVAAGGLANMESGAAQRHVVDASELRVALEVFARRQIKSPEQLEGVRSTIIHYQRHPDEQVRQQCSVSVIKLLSNWVQYSKEQCTTNYFTRVVEILDQYLRHVVMELDPNVRFMEVKLLADAVELRPFLREQRILRKIMSILHDVSRVREKIVELLVSLTRDPQHNPSDQAVQHSLLTVVESCAAALEYSTDTRILVRHMSDLQTVAKFSLTPLMNHLDRILVAFLKRLLDEATSDAIALYILKTLQTILTVIRREERMLLQFKDVTAELYAPVVCVLRASTSASLSHAAIAALVCMNDIGASPCEWNARELHDFLQAITSVYIATTGSSEEELGYVLTLFGQLGAVDPSTKPDAGAVKKYDETVIQDEADLELTYDYTKIVYRDLSRMLDLSLSETVCVQAMRMLLHLVQTTSDRKELVGGTHAVKAIVQIAKRATDAPLLRVEALHTLAAITLLRHEKVCKTLLPEIVVLLEQLWYPHDRALFRAVLDLVGALKPGSFSGKEQAEVWPWLYPRLVDVALQDHTESREFALRVVWIILRARFIPPHCIPVVFPMLTQFAQQMDQLVELRALSLCGAIHVLCVLKAVHYLSSLMHTIRTLTRHCELCEDLGPRLSTPMVLRSLSTLATMYRSWKVVISALRKRMRADNSVNPDEAEIPVVSNRETIVSRGSDSDVYGLVRVSHHGQQSQCRQPGSVQQENPYMYANDDEACDAPSKGRQDITILIQHVESGLRMKGNKWREWFAEFQKNIIVVSPHPVFRTMVDLFDKYEPLRRKLFYPSFKCFYESLKPDHMKKVKDVLNLALQSSDIEVVSKCIGLADYLDHNTPMISAPVLQQLRSLERNDHDYKAKMVNYKSKRKFQDIPQQQGPKRNILQSTFSDTDDGDAIGGDLGDVDDAVATTHAAVDDDFGCFRSQGSKGLGTFEQVQLRRGGDDCLDDELALQSLGSFTHSNAVKHGEKVSRSVGIVTAGKGGDATVGNFTGDGGRAAAYGREHVRSLRADRNCISSNDSCMDRSRNGSDTSAKETNGQGAAAEHWTFSDHGGEVVGQLDQLTCLRHGEGKASSPHAMGKRAGAGHGNEQNECVAELTTFTRAPPIPNTVNSLFTGESLVDAALRTRMYDKAMSYLENKLLPVLDRYRYARTIPKSVLYEYMLPLASLYSRCEMQDSVVGLFRAMRYENDGEDGFAYELLRRWDVAQGAYKKKLLDSNVKSSLGVVEGYVRTLCYCGEWESALRAAKDAYKHLEQPSSTIAQSGAMAAWVLGEWEDVEALSKRLPTKEKGNTALQLFFQNAVILHHEFASGGRFARDQNGERVDFDSLPVVKNLRRSILRARMEVDESLKTLLALSYAHAYENITLLQHFTEMEEQIAYVGSKSDVFRKQLVERWKRRFAALKPDSLMPSLRSLMLHSLVLKPNEMSAMVVDFCNGIGESYPQLSKWAMAWLQRDKFPRSSDEFQYKYITSKIPLTLEPRVAVEYIGQVWNEGKQREAVRLMEDFLNESQETLEEQQPLAYGFAQLRLGTWKQALDETFWNYGRHQEVLRHLHGAVRAMPDSWEAWHSWGLMNYRVHQRDHTLTRDQQRAFVEAAHQGFVAAICRTVSPSTALPGVMRLLQLWVFHNGMSLLKESVADSVSRIPVDYWAQAIPQLIGHLRNASHDVRDVIAMIIQRLCVAHSQAVVFPLLVVLMSDDGSDGETQPKRRELAQSIVSNIPKRVYADAETVARLLIEASATPIERIRECLSAVSTAWNPTAEYEEDNEEVQRRLKSALDLFNIHRLHLLYSVGDIGQYVKMVIDDEKAGKREKALGIIGQLVDEITKHISEKLGKEPQKAMEPLLALRNLSIAVFGEYDIKYTNFPTITSFSSKLDVIPSKKRPRRIRLSGSNGCTYAYCLKGNEDIRMDERVMQLFGMVNVLLSDARISKSAFIHRFPVIPISNSVGLLGWVECASTINNTICTHRSTISKIHTHHESNVFRSYVESIGNWDKLSMIQRTEVLDYVMSQRQCEAVDVARAMWHRSNTAEQWLERRTAFTQSLATMSMVGYVLGLGDRHLGNILLSMSTGKIVHIDFGDSFDVGRLRHVLPETVPFRLTRMLTNAMEVFGVDGVFRASCNRTQTTLQKNADSIMALLSAFVHDPIVQHKGKMKNMMEKSRTPQDIVERIRNKLRGTEMAVEDADMVIFNTVPESSRRPDLLYMSHAFNDAARRPLARGRTTEQQVSMLIDEATQVENYAALYFGWGPFW
ncbi:putative phosphatidylinositol 3 kinase [Trypanosoma vivax]|nr:putative phosphatidylinositol 3 kinase [Trypanosoma vivax]